MKILPRIAAVLATGLIVNVFGLNLTTPPDYTTPDAVNPDSIAALTSYTGDAPLKLIYKQNEWGQVQGGIYKYQNSYTPTFEHTQTGSSATLTYNISPDWEPAYATGDPIYLVIKGGNDAAAVWDISNWDGQETIKVTGLTAPAKGLFSVSIYSTVPDGGATALLLGSAFIALAGLSRMKR